MTNTKKFDRCIISVGGSLIVTSEGINMEFLTKLNKLIRDQLVKHKNRQFFLVVGGGATARQYRDAGRDIVGHELTNEDLDWLGIHATRLNAHLVRTIFQDIAHPKLITDYDIIQKTDSRVVVAGGYRPGWSTDFCATLLCEDYKVETVINLTNIKQLYNKDPNEFKDATPIDTIDWNAFRDLVGDDWAPGMHAPFDPIAARKAQEFGLKVVLMSGHDFENIENYFEGKKYLGTIIG